MKKLIYSLLGLGMMLAILSFSNQRPQTKTKFSKDVWLEIDFKQDSTMFIPYSKAWKGGWTYSLTSDNFDFNTYQSSFKNRPENLWTIIHPEIINGSLTVFSPCDLEDYQKKDNGDLRYPIKKSMDKNYSNSKEERYLLGEYLGYYGPESDIPLVDIYGDDSVNANNEYVYPPRKFSFYEDIDLVKFKIKEYIVLDKNGQEKKRIIKSIAPIVYQKESFSGEVQGEKELLWLDFNELKPILKEKFYQDSNGKPVSFLDYFEKRKFMFKVVKEEKKVLNVLK